MENAQGTLNKDLARLGANIPFLLKEFPNKREVWAELAGLIDDIQARAKPGDREWATERIDALLLMNGISSRPERKEILEEVRVTPEPFYAVRVGVARLDSIAIGCDPDPLQPLRPQRAESHQEHLQYELKAWSEGSYARHCGQRSDRCLYEYDSEMARAWLRGWGCQEPPSSGLKDAGRPEVPSNLRVKKRLAI